MTNGRAVFREWRGGAIARGATLFRDAKKIYLIINLFMSCNDYFRIVLTPTVFYHYVFIILLLQLFLNKK